MAVLSYDALVSYIQARVYQNMNGSVTAAVLQKVLLDLTESLYNNPTEGSPLVTALTDEIARAEAAEALLAPLDSAALTGNPTAPTQAPGTNNTRLATTAYADAAVAVEAAIRAAAVVLLAPLASPSLTGNPTTPTQPQNDASTRIANTAYADRSSSAAVSQFLQSSDQYPLVVTDPVGFALWAINAAGEVVSQEWRQATAGSFEVADQIGSILARFDANGLNVTKIAALSQLGMTHATLSDEPGDFALIVADPAGWTIAALRDDGALYVSSLSTGSGGAVGQYTTAELLNRSARALALMNSARMQTDDTSAAPVWNYNHVFVYGQSLAVGFEGWPAKTTSGRSDVLMVGNAVRPGGAGTATTAVPLTDANFHPAVATVQDPSTGVTLSAGVQASLAAGATDYGEEVGVAAMQFARRLFLQRLGAVSDPRLFVVSNVGVGGKTLAQLSKGASPEYYNRFFGMANAGKAAALAASGTYGVAALFWLQGENDYNLGGGTYTSKADYKAAMLTLYSDFVADIAVGIAGQADPPAIITYQTSGQYVVDAADLSISEAQIELSQENNSWYIAAPSYPFTDKGGHLDANGYRWLSMYFAKAFHEVVVMRRKWKPLSPIRATYRGSTIAVDFYVPAPPMQFQPFYVGSTPTSVINQGFTVIDGSGAVTVAAVEIIGDAVVQIVCARPLVAPVNVYYGRQSGAQGGGNLCDSDGLAAPFPYDYSAGSGDYVAANIADLVGKPYPLWNWCVLFKMAAVAN